MAKEGAWRVLMRKVSFHPNQLLPSARQEVAKEGGDGFASDVASVQLMIILNYIFAKTNSLLDVTGMMFSVREEGGD